MKLLEHKWTACTSPDAPGAVVSSSVESSWEIHVATLFFAFYWDINKEVHCFSYCIIEISCFSFHFPTLFMAINCITLQCLKWMCWDRITGWVYSVSCEAMWCWSHLKDKKKFNLAVDFTPELCRKLQEQVNRSCHCKTQSLIFVGLTQEVFNLSIGDAWWVIVLHMWRIKDLKRSPWLWVSNDLRAWKTWRDTAFGTV